MKQDNIYQAKGLLEKISMLAKDKRIQKIYQDFSENLDNLSVDYTWQLISASLLSLEDKHYLDNEGLSEDSYDNLGEVFFHYDEGVFDTYPTTNIPCTFLNDKNECVGLISDAIGYTAEYEFFKDTNRKLIIDWKNDTNGNYYVEYRNNIQPIEEELDASSRTFDSYQYEDDEYYDNNLMDIDDFILEEEKETKTVYFGANSLLIEKNVFNFEKFIKFIRNALAHSQYELNGEYIRLYLIDNGTNQLVFNVLMKQDFVLEIIRNYVNEEKRLKTTVNFFQDSIWNEKNISEKDLAKYYSQYFEKPFSEIFAKKVFDASKSDKGFDLYNANEKLLTQYFKSPYEILNFILNNQMDNNMDLIKLREDELTIYVKAFLNTTLSEIKNTNANNNLVINNVDIKYPLFKDTDEYALLKNNLSKTNTRLKNTINMLKNNPSKKGQESAKKQLKKINIELKNIKAQIKNKTNSYYPDVVKHIRDSLSHGYCYFEKDIDYSNFYDNVLYIFDYKKDEKTFEGRIKIGDLISSICNYIKTNEINYSKGKTLCKTLKH